MTLCFVLLKFDFFENCDIAILFVTYFEELSTIYNI